MNKEEKIYDERILRQLKRSLLGFCGEKTIKSHQSLINAINKTDIIYFHSSVEQAIVNLLELSKSNNLTYRVSGDTFFVDPETITYYRLHINKESNESYKVFISQDEIYCPSSENPENSIAGFG